MKLDLTTIEATILLVLVNEHLDGLDKFEHTDYHDAVRKLRDQIRLELTEARRKR